jgi:hypothetical protein
MAAAFVDPVTVCGQQTFVLADCGVTYVKVPGLMETHGKDGCAEIVICPSMKFSAPYGDRTLSEERDILVLERSHAIKIFEDALSDTGSLWKQNNLERSLDIALRTFMFTLIFEGWRKRHAARVIQRYFRMAMVNPAYRMCQRRLKREFESIGGI